MRALLSVTLKTCCLSVARLAAVSASARQTACQAGCVPTLVRMLGEGAHPLAGFGLAAEEEAGALRLATLSGARLHIGAVAFLEVVRSPAPGEATSARRAIFPVAAGVPCVGRGGDRSVDPCAHLAMEAETAVHHLLVLQVVHRGACLSFCLLVCIHNGHVSHFF